MVKINGQDYAVAWDALATVEFYEAIGIKYVNENVNLRELFGMDGAEDQKISTVAMRNLVHFCHVSLKAADERFPLSFRELFNTMNKDTDLTKSLMAQSMEAFVKANNVPNVDQEAGKVMADG